MTRLMGAEMAENEEVIDTVEVVAPGDVLVEDVLVEEVSIDGMCGVY